MIKKILLLLALIGASLVPVVLTAPSASALTCAPYFQFSTLSDPIDTPNSGILRERRTSYSRICTTSAFDKVIQVQRQRVEIDWVGGGCGSILKFTFDVDSLGGIDKSNVSRDCVGFETVSATFWYPGDGVNIWVTTPQSERCLNTGVWAYSVLGIGIWSDPIISPTHCFNP